MTDITEATVQDVDDVGGFIKELWAAAGPGAPGLTGATEEIIEEISRPEMITGRLGGPDRRIFLARDREVVVGFAATRRIDAEAVELAGIMVHPDSQGGVGTPLLEMAALAMRSDGYRRMVVHTETDNVAALRFYRKRGFLPTRELVEAVEGTPVDVAELELEL